MENPAVNVEVNARVWYQDPWKGCLSKVVISLSREVEEFLLDESDGSVSSLRSHPSSSPPDPLISLEFQNLIPIYVLRHLRNHLHDPLLFRLVSKKILVAAKGRDLSRPSLFMIIAVKLTQKEYLVVPSVSAPSTATDPDQESCAICLENMLESKTNHICQLPDCSHLFHEQCLNKWLDRQQNSCPLCRQSVDILA
ncbi:unnamed protein product [Arabis nemorensis]|uniref:RING-type domain-containing protein n=1 Tax=Arabis nemorensis TaxID=586526 RepID=A0A565CA68_9BRAS|nr:unnamed protein product [Arabis nemorensis]